MMNIKRIQTGVSLFLLSASASATISTSQVSSALLDTRTYRITVLSDQPYCSPEAGTYGVARGGGIALFANPYEDSNAAYVASGWLAEGGVPQASDPGGGPWFSSAFYPTSLVSTVSWSWDAYYSLRLLTSGEGAVLSTPSAALKQKSGTEFTLTAAPSDGWLFTGWSGAHSGGPSTTGTVYVLTAPAVVTASFSDDPDGDGLKNVDEWAVGGNPWEADTDGDGFDDLFEFNNGLSLTRDSSGFVTHIQDNPETYGLYTSNALIDVAVGQVALNIEGATARLRLQVEQSDDLVTWTNAGDVVEWTMPVTGEKRFMRVRSGR
jgi:hypothetical protein